MKVDLMGQHKTKTFTRINNHLTTHNMKTTLFPIQLALSLRFKHTLLFIALLVMCSKLTQAQVSGIHFTQPAGTNTVITSRCDLHFCITDSFGLSNISSSFYISSHYPDVSTTVVGDVAGASHNGVHATGTNSSICVYPRDQFSIQPGIHTFYLGFSAHGIVDSITLNISNIILSAFAGVTYSVSSIGTSGEKYLLTFNSGLMADGVDGFNVWVNSRAFFMGSGGSVSDTITQRFNGVHTFDYSLKAIGSCVEQNDPTGGGRAFTVTYTVTNGCPEGTTSEGVFGYLASCSDTFRVRMDYVSYVVNGVPVSCTTTPLPISATITWGDGTASTVTLSCVGPDYYIISPMTHKYDSPGTYTYKLEFFNAGIAVCSSNIIGSVTIESCGNLTGTIYHDANNDCNQQGGEPGIENIQVKATSLDNNNIYTAWTDPSGNYAFGTIPEGNYWIQIDGALADYTMTCGNSLPHITNISQTGTTVENFALYLDPAACNDFDVVTGWGMMGVHGEFFPGEEAIITPIIGITDSTCTQTISGSVKLILDPCLSYTGPGSISSVNGPPDQVIPAPGGDTLVWHVADINQIGTLYYWDYAAAVLTCTSAQVGDSVCITTIVSPSLEDTDPTNNRATSCFLVGVSHDPNDKSVAPKGTDLEGNIPQSTNKLTYTLRFQNTGTATARNIYLLDTISPHLDLESLDIVASSHPMQPYLLPNRTMKFMFAKIMLPDSTHDEAHSHGYVTYRINPHANLPYGTQINNTGYIYFDYNAPVVTNTTRNTIAAPTGVNALAMSDNLQVYPNPAKEVLVISIPKMVNGVVTITDVLGKEVMQQHMAGLHMNMNISHLQNGVYFVNIGQYTQKVVISK